MCDARNVSYIKRAVRQCQYASRETSILLYFHKSNPSTQIHRHGSIDTDTSTLIRSDNVLWADSLLIPILCGRLAPLRAEQGVSSFVHSSVSSVSVT